MKSLGRNIQSALMTAAFAVALGAVTAATPSAATVSGRGPTTTAARVSEAPQSDVAQLATDLAISVEEVEAQLALQDAMDTIPFSKLDLGYAEDGSVPGRDFHLWYRSALEPSAGLIDAMKAAGVLQHVSFERVPLSLEDLMARAVAVNSVLTVDRVPVGVTIDTKSGGVVFHPYEGASDAARKDAEAVAERDSLPFSWGEPPPTPANYGGKAANFPAGQCTAAFVVETSGGDRRVTSAGHCGAVGESVTYGQETGFTVGTRSFTSFRDVLTFDKASETWSPKVKYAANGTTRDVDAVRLWNQMDVGDPVSKYGRATDYTIGTIVDRHACAAFPQTCDPEALYVRVQVDTGTQMCAEGDSGGPYMLANTAYGIGSARFSDGDCTFTPQQLITGGTVVTRP